MTVSDLRKLLAALPDDMEVRMCASVADELPVKMAETYPGRPESAYDRKAVLMLCDGAVEGSGAGSTVIWDERDGE